MESWLKLSLLLCCFGFMKEIRPSEPFIYEYLIGPWRNVTVEEVNREVYPVGTYGYLSQLIVIFLITDLLRYKPLIVISGLAGICVWSMLIWTTELIWLQVLEVLYGTFMATEVAYYTYAYAKVPREFYQQVTGHTRAAILAGRAISGVIAQILVSFELMDYKQLNYITFAAMIMATIWAVFLPPVNKTIYFHRNNVNDHENGVNRGDDKRPKNDSSKYASAFKLMRRHFKQLYTDSYIAKWSVWWALTTCGFVQVQTYMQPLWEEIVSQNGAASTNGTALTNAVDSILTTNNFSALSSAYTALSGNAHDGGQSGTTHHVLTLNGLAAMSNAYTALNGKNKAIGGLARAATFANATESGSASVDERPRYYNGIVETLLTLLGFGGAIFAGASRVDWCGTKGELILSLCAIVEGALLILASQTSDLILCYACYIGYGAIYHYAVTASSAEIAKRIADDSYGLIFGFNTTMALVLQTILTLAVVTGDLGLALTPRDQYLVYGIYHFGVAALFICIGLVVWIRSDRDTTKTYN